MDRVELSSILIGIAIVLLVSLIVIFGGALRVRSRGGAPPADDSYGAGFPPAAPGSHHHGHSGHHGDHGGSSHGGDAGGHH